MQTKTYWEHRNDHFKYASNLVKRPKQINKYNFFIAIFGNSSYFNLLVGCYKKKKNCKITVRNNQFHKATVKPFNLPGHKSSNMKFTVIDAVKSAEKGENY